MTQAQRILEYVHTNGSITSLEAIQHLGITQLSSRISELRRKGYDFEKVPEKVKNRYGESCTILRYFPIIKKTEPNAKS